VPANKRKRRPTGFDIRRAIAAYAEASQKAHAWAEKSMALRIAGLPTAADRAEEKAHYWLRKMIALGALVPRGELPDGPHAGG